MCCSLITFDPLFSCVLFYFTPPAFVHFLLAVITMACLISQQITPAFIRNRALFLCQLAAFVFSISLFYLLIRHEQNVQTLKMLSYIHN